MGMGDEGLEPLTVDQLIANLQAIRAKVGGDVPVVLCDFEPVVRAGVVYHPGPVQDRVRRTLAGEDDCPPQAWVIITDRYEE
jgi:hypothetical protein